MFPDISVTQRAEQANNANTKSAKGDWPDAPTVMQSFNHSAASAAPLNDINIKLDQLMEIIQTQNCQISELRNEVAELKKSHSTVAASAAKPIQNADAILNTQKLELRLSRLIEEYLNRYERDHKQRLEMMLMAK